MTPANSSSVITPQQRADYQSQGFFLLENVVPAAHLQLLRAKVDENIARIDAEMDAAGLTRQGINHRGSRYFVSAYQETDHQNRPVFVFRFDGRHHARAFGR